MNNLVKKISTAVLYGAIAFSSFFGYSGCSTQQNRKALCLENELRIIQEIGRRRPEIVILKEGYSDKRVRAKDLYESTKKPSFALLIDVNNDGLPELVLDGTASRIKTGTGVAVRYGNQDGTYSPSQELSEEGLEKVLRIFD